MGKMSEKHMMIVEGRARKMVKKDPNLMNELSPWELYLKAANEIEEENRNE